jgi:hypothetical protein
LTVESLSVALWRQRDLLSEIHHQLYVQSLLLRDGASNHHLSRNTAVIRRLEAESVRASLLVNVNLDALAQEWELEIGSRLSHLVAEAPDALSQDVLQQHLHALVALTDKVRQFTAENSQALSIILGGTQTQLSDPATYNAAGLVMRETAGPVIERTM